MKLHLQPITYSEAAHFIDRHHSHNVPSRGQKFSIAVNDGSKVVGVAMAGRPIARHLDDGYTCEVTRVCIMGGYKNACSMLYAACWRAARAMGYRRAISYTRQDENGTGLIAAGYKVIGAVKAQSWHRSNRPRVDKSAITQRSLWEVR